VVARFSFAVSAALAAAGTALGVFGILASETKPIAIGMVLIFGGAVFALLYIGSRRASGRSTLKPTVVP
jgi:hypothetical protein